MRRIKFRGMDIDDNTWIYGGIDQLSENIILHGGYGGSIYCKDGTIGQYTGIKDINNKEIYEGDLVMIEDYPKWEGSFKVIWDNEQSMYVLEDYYGDKEALHQFEKYRIIGNVYENKNLLEEV